MLMKIDYRPDTSLEHTQQREKMLNISSQSMETTDMLAK